MADEKFVLPSDLPEEPAAPAKITVRPADARPAFVLPSEEEERAHPTRTNTTVYDYPQIYQEMRRESQEQVGRGIEQLRTPTGGDLAESAKQTLYGVGNVGLGALGYVTSPINAAYRAVVGEPVEQRTGIPKAYTEFAAQLATPGLGLKQLGQPLTPVTKVKPPREGRLADEMRLYTKEGQEEMAGLAMKGSTKTPVPALRDKLRDVEEIVPGSEPTTFQATGDYGLGQLERGVATKEQAPFAERRAEQAAARHGALEKDVIRPGSPEEVANDLRARMKAEDAAAEAAEKAAVARAEATTQTATARAEAADRAAGGTGFTPDISGQVFQRELTEANTASRNAASRLWDDIDPQGRLSVDASPVMNAEFRARNNMTLADAEGVTDAERAIQRVINSYGPITPFREMRSLRSLISTAMREERRRVGESPAWGRMAELRRAVEDSVAAPFERGVPAGPQQAAMSADAADRLAAATAATKERAATFKVEPVQGVIRPGQGGELRATPSTVPGKIIPNGPKGYDTVQAYLRATQGRPGGGLQDVSEALVADMRAYATAVDGTLDPGRVMSWARGKQHALRAVSELDGGALARRLEEVQTSGFGVKAATKEQARTIKEAAAERAAVSKKGNEGIFGDLMGVRDKEDISKLLGSVFGSKTAVNDAREIMSRLTTPEAQDGARRAITDWMTNKLISNTAAGTTEIDILRADQFQTFVKSSGAILREFGFTPEQIKTMELIAKDLRRAKMSIDATKVPGGSNTAQDLYAMKKFGLQGSNLSKVLHLIGGATGGITAGPLGAAIGFLSAGRVKVLRDRGIKSVQELLVEGMVDPSVGHMLLGKSLPQERIAFWRTVGKFGARAARTSIITGGPHPDQSAPTGYADGGAVFPASREGIKARNKARAAAARERSSLARGAAQAKGKVKYQGGGEVTSGADNTPLTGPGELFEGQHDRTARGRAAGTGGFGGPYQSVAGEIIRPDTRARYPIRQVPIQGEAPSAPDPGPVDEDQAAAELLHDYRRSFGMPAGAGTGLILGTKPYPVYADGGLTRGSEGDVGDAAAAFSDHPVINAMERMHQARQKAMSFDPEGTGYDMESARAAGIEPDATGHWPSRLPDTGLILKGRAHKSYPLTEEGERQAGYEITQGAGGRYYSQPRFEDGGEVNDDSGEPDPLDAELARRNVPGGLGPNVGPTITSTVPRQDIPPTPVNAQGETFPAFAAKAFANKMYALPQQAGRSAMQAAEGDPDYNPTPILETAKLVMGSPSVPRGALGSGPAIKTWHASPHDFERFDINKIGTGQGAASYGKGIYTAESPAVSGVGGEYWKEFAHKGVDQFYPMHKVHERIALEHLIRANGNRNEAAGELARGLASLPKGSSSAGMYEDAIGLLESSKHIGPRVYETNIKAPSAEFLDWDAPLGDQLATKKMPGLLDAAAREANDRAMASTTRSRQDALHLLAKEPERGTGEFAYQGLLAQTRGTPRAASKQAAMEDMRDAGIPGIRYLDAGSRDIPRQLIAAKARLADVVERGGAERAHVGTPEYQIALKDVLNLERTPQTRNYVVHRDDILEIINKFGWAGLAPLGISVEMAREALKDQGFASGGRVKDDSGKASKKSVNYSKGMPKAHCGICTHFSKGTCSEVKGTIYASMWCELFKRKNKYAEGGKVEPDPLDEELKRRNVPGGLGPTAGPTVTSTTPVQDIPAPKVNAEGETLPTYVLKEMGKGLLGAPEQFTHAAGDLQRRGEYAGSQEDMPYGGPPPEEMPAGAAAALMLYGANAPFPKPGIGIFGGRGALTANKGMLAEAEKMLAAGVPHATIRNRTGWEFGADGQPRFEISDAQARIKPEHPEDRIYEADAASRATGLRPNQRLEQQLEHQAAYEAYPWLKDMKTSLEVGEGIKPGASFTPGQHVGLLSQGRGGKLGEIEVRAPTYERGGVGDLFEKQYASDVGARDMLLHEMQHAIQEREGFAPGSNPRQLPLTRAEVTLMTKRMAKREGLDWDRASPSEREKMERVIRHRIYKAQAGEAEARNVQTRADSTLPSRPSWETEDVAREHQMIEKTGKLKRGEKPFKDAKIYKLERPPGEEVPQQQTRLTGQAPVGGGRSPGIYKDPRLIAREAAELIPPEHPALHGLFNVHREDLYDISQQGRRQGNLPDPAWTAPLERGRGSEAAKGIMTPGNEQRILDAMVEAGKHPGLRLADAWYVMDPAYQRLEYLHGPELAKRLYDRMNTTGAMTSPASGVWDEIRRGTAANMMAHRGEFPRWQQWAGIAKEHRPERGQPFVPIKGVTSKHVEHLAGQQFPPELREIPGHLAHRTAHALPIENYLRRGVVEMGTPKVPTYIPASGVPETGFQTRWMVPDAHISKSLGMGDTRTPGTVRQGASMSMPEYREIAPWYRQRIAEPLGVEAVPAQARQWTLFGPQTGVRTFLGVPKLELLAQRIWERALANGWDPKVLRDQVLSGGAHAGLAAGVVAPALAGLGDDARQ